MAPIDRRGPSKLEIVVYSHSGGSRWADVTNVASFARRISVLSIFPFSLIVKQTLAANKTSVSGRNLVTSKTRVTETHVNRSRQSCEFQGCRSRSSSRHQAAQRFGYFIISAMRFPLTRVMAAHFIKRFIGFYNTPTQPHEGGACAGLPFALISRPHFHKSTRS